MADSLWDGVTSHPTPIVVLAMSSDDDLEAAFDVSRASQDDAFWAAFVMAPFSWSRFLTWWITRRWVVPRDVRRQ